MAKDTIFCLGRVESDFLEDVALALRPFHRKFRSRRRREGDFGGFNDHCTAISVSCVVSCLPLVGLYGEARLFF